MRWVEKCNELFDQYREKLDEYKDCLKEFQETLNSMEQCMWFQDYEELSYWANRAEVEYMSY